MVWGRSFGIDESSPSGDTGIDDLLSRVRNDELSSLCILPLRNFSSYACLSLASALRTHDENSSLKELIVSSRHEVSADSLYELGAAIRSSQVDVVSVGGGRSFAEEGVRALCRGIDGRAKGDGRVKGKIVHEKRMKRVDLQGRGLGVYAATCLAESLLTPTPLNTCPILYGADLILADNDSIGDEGVVALINQSRYTTTNNGAATATTNGTLLLSHLDLRNTQCGDNGIIALADAISPPPDTQQQEQEEEQQQQQLLPLHSLDLSRNTSISSHAWCSLCRALSSHSRQCHISTLLLDYNTGLGGEAVMALMESLAARWAQSRKMTDKETANRTEEKRGGHNGEDKCINGSRDPRYSMQRLSLRGIGIKNVDVFATLIRDKSFASHIRSLDLGENDCLSSSNSTSTSGSDSLSIVDVFDSCVCSAGSQIEELSLFGLGLTDAHVEEMMQLVTTRESMIHSCLTELDLGGNNLSYESIHLLLQQLGSPSTPTSGGQEDGHGSYLHLPSLQHLIIAGSPGTQCKDKLDDLEHEVSVLQRVRPKIKVAWKN